MKKSMILFIFLELLIITKEEDMIDLIFQGKCEDKKAKTKACMYNMHNYDDKNHNKYSLFNKCGKGQICDDEFGCTKGEYEKLKIGKSCNYDQDCETNSCKSNKCTAAKENEKCYPISCETGLICYYNGDNYKCVKPAIEGQKAEKTECMPGLGEDKEGKCVKYGTVKDGDQIGGNEFICNSGLSHPKYDDKLGFITICDSIDIEPVCDKDNTIKAEGKWKDGTAIKYGCTTREDYNGKEIYYHPNYSKLKTTFFTEFLKGYEDLDLDKINSNEKYSSWLDGMKSETREKWYLYRYATHLKAAGLIDSDGKVVGDKKCEYEFFMKKYGKSNFMKLNTIILAIIALLF